MSTPITIPATGTVDNSGNCTMTIGSPPIGTSYVASVTVANSPGGVNWNITVGGILVGQAFGGGAAGPFNIQEGSPVVISATALTPGNQYTATLNGTADTTKDSDWSYPQPQVPSVEIGTGTINVTGNVDIANTPNVQVFSFQSAVLSDFLISSSVGGGTTVIIPTWVASIYLLVHTAGNFFTAMTINGASTNLTYMNAPLVTLIGGFVPLTSIAVAPGIETSLNITWSLPSNNAHVWVVGTSQPPQNNTETFQTFTDFTGTAASGTTTIILPLPGSYAGSGGYVWEIARTMVNAPTTAASTSAIYLADSGSIPIELAYSQANGTVGKSDSHYYWNDSLTLHNQSAVTAAGLVIARLVPEAGGVL